jgi:hypothetical protein
MSLRRFRAAIASFAITLILSLIAAASALADGAPPGWP